ncbi:hypothetical protein ASL20_32480 [Cupriavidus necator]|nr:hypothetical protein ASL20_32480 [Cupriavidus necator]
MRANESEAFWASIIVSIFDTFISSPYDSALVQDAVAADEDELTLPVVARRLGQHPGGHAGPVGRAGHTGLEQE